MKCTGSFHEYNRTIQSNVDVYRNKYIKHFWVHGVDMQGYGTQQFCGKNFNLIAGWSDSAPRFIHLAEIGRGFDAPGNRGL